MAKSRNGARREGWEKYLNGGPPKQQRKPQGDPEHQQQVALFQWADALASRYPILHRLYAVPNGADRHPAVAGKLKAEGVKRGVPDIVLPTPRHGYHGLYLELKAGGSPTPEQRQWLRDLTAEGYLAAVVVGWISAAATIARYLEMDPSVEQQLTGPEQWPCRFCGYPFDHDKRGKNGCPQCKGEGLDRGRN